MSFEDEPTQQLRRPAAPAPMPGPLDLTRPAGDDAGQAPSDGGTDRTEVLSLDEMFSAPGAPGAPAAAAPAPAAPAPAAPTPAAARAPMAVVPVRTDPHAAPAAGIEPVETLPDGSVEPARRGGPSLAERVRTDARVALDAGWRRSRAWIGEADNALIAATVLVALLLIVVVAAI